MHQILPTLSWGDAVGNHALHLQALLRARGFESDLFAGQWDERSEGRARRAAELPRACDRNTVLLVHHSFESHFLPLIRRSKARVFVMFHNITPAWHFERFERALRDACNAARDELYQLAGMAERAFAYSRFSAEELTACGFPPPEVFPFTVDWKAFDVAPDEQFAAQFEDGCTNLLFVGRAVPNKRVEDVLRVFTAYQRLFDREARLLVAGQFSLHSPYVAWLKELRSALGPERVHFLGRVTQPQLSALYRVAHAYLSMSRHEGFGVPLLEAMHRDVPVVAYGAAAVPETMGGAGLVLRNDDPVVAAEALAVLKRDGVRERVLAGQRERLRAFGDEAVACAVDQVLVPAVRTRATLRPPLEPARRLVVCPAFELAPDGAEAATALQVAKSSGPGARILTLGVGARPRGNGPDIEIREGVEIHRFTPELPLRSSADVSREGPPVRSSSLESAVLASTAEVVFIDGKEELAKALLPRLGHRGSTSPVAVSATMAEGAASRRKHARG